MNVSKEILEKLKCANCNYYLSCGPVYIKHEDGEAICGRCSKPQEEPVTLNKQYETVAELLHFPCKYAEFGCKEKLKFSHNNSHEKNCNYRERSCPIAEKGKCDWLGQWKDLLQHCKAKHPNLVLENPCSIRHDFSETKNVNYLLVAFNFLFLLRTKVCCKTRMIVYRISLLEESEKAKEFEYTLNIKRNKENLSKCGIVASLENNENQGNFSICLPINSLKQIFGGFDDMVFNITLNKIKLEKVINKKRKLTHSKPQNNKSCSEKRNAVSCSIFPLSPQNSQGSVNEEQNPNL